MNLDEFIDKALVLMDRPNVDRRQVMRAYAESVRQHTLKAVPRPASTAGRCSGCGRDVGLCATCTAKNALGGLVLNGLGLNFGGGSDDQPPPINVGRVRGRPVPPPR